MSNILFFGDLASPDSFCSEELLKSLKANNEVFKNNVLVGNLEGLIAEMSTNTKTPILFNHPSILDTLKYANTKAVSLSNNHTLDIPDFFNNTTTLLERNNIAYCGADTDKENAEKATSFDMDGAQFFVYGYSWELMFHNQKNPKKGLHVAKIERDKLIKRIKENRNNYSESKIIVLLHWNFDLEKLPFPMDRELAKDLIDAGANVIIGSHSHCVQGVERYKDGIIAYCLGNFFIPWHTYINGHIEFPEFSRLTLCLEWNPVSNSLMCHWFRYENQDDRHRLVLVESEDFEKNNRVNLHTPFQGMTKKEYEQFFKKNRRKNFLLPVYKSYNDSMRNLFINEYLKKRIWFARLLAKFKLREWNN